MNSIENGYIVKQPFFSQDLTLENRDELFLATQHHNGWGGAIYSISSAIDEICRHYGIVDILVNSTQAGLYKYDPRIREIIIADSTLYPDHLSELAARVFVEGKKTVALTEHLREQNYEAIYPGNLALGQLRKVGKLMLPNALGVLQDYLKIKNSKFAPASRRVKATVRSHFSSDPQEFDDIIPLYLSSDNIINARNEIEKRKDRLGIPYDALIIGIAPDTTSPATRPSRDLLCEAVVKGAPPESLIYILPSYTDREASGKLTGDLEKYFPGHVYQIPDDPRPSLLYTAALIDQFDLFLTGDTGSLHLGAAYKKLNPKDNQTFQPRNLTYILGLYGLTNPYLYGYDLPYVINFGQGRKEQKKLWGGYCKVGYRPRNIDYFDHINPEDISFVMKEILRQKVLSLENILNLR